MWGLGCSSGLEEGGMRCQGLHVVVSNWPFGFLYIYIYISNLAASKQVKVDWEQEDHQIKLKTVHGTLRQFQADQLPLWSSWAMSSFGSAFFESSPTVSDSLSVVTSDRTVFTSSCMNVPMLGNRFSIRGPCVEDAQKNKQVCPFHHFFWAALCFVQVVLAQRIFEIFWNWVTSTQVRNYHPARSCWHLAFRTSLGQCAHLIQHLCCIGHAMLCWSMIQCLTGTLNLQRSTSTMLGLFEDLAVSLQGLDLG